MADRDVLINENSLIAVADAIRAKSGTQSSYTVAQMPAAITAINTPAITVTDTIDTAGGIIKTINAINIGDTTATAGDVARGKYFYTASGVKTVGMANSVEDILLDYLNHQLTGNIIYTGTTLEKISLQKQIGITSLSFPNVTTFINVAASGFAEMTGLISFSAPLAQRQPGNLLNGCTSLTSLNLDSLTDTGNLLLNDCRQLTAVVLPAVQNIYSQTVRGCTNLEVFDVLASNGFTNQNNMYGCSKLTKLIIRKNGVATLSNVNNFTGTPFADGGAGGEIYVPSAQINNYKSASNWSVVDGYGTITWKAIEESYYETHYGDGRNIS